MDYCIKEGYISNLEPKRYNAGRRSQNLSRQTWQPDVYTSALTLAKKLNAEYVIDLGSGSGEKLPPFEAEFKLITVDYGNQAVLEKVLKDFTFISYDLNIGLPDILPQILKKSVIIFSDCIEHLTTPEHILRDLKIASEYALAIIISTPDRDLVRGKSDFGPPANKLHVREWNLDEFGALLIRFQFPNFIIGHTREHNLTKQRKTIMAVIEPNGNTSRIDINDLHNFTQLTQ